MAPAKAPGFSGSRHKPQPARWITFQVSEPSSTEAMMGRPLAMIE
jgi:hypothetical protein